MSKYIDENEVYKLVEPSGTARVHCSQIDSLPRADAVEVRHGEWVWDFNLDGDDFFRCSVCGRQEVINGLCRERNPIEKFPYCHCGAKMDGERREK